MEEKKEYSNFKIASYILGITILLEITLVAIGWIFGVYILEFLLTILGIDSFTVGLMVIGTILLLTPILSLFLFLYFTTYKISRKAIIHKNKINGIMLNFSLIYIILNILLVLWSYFSEEFAAYHILYYLGIFIIYFLFERVILGKFSKVE